LPISLMAVIPWYAVFMEPILANSLLTLEENIHVQGAPTKSGSDCAPVQISEKLQDITLIYPMNNLTLKLLYTR